MERVLRPVMIVIDGRIERKGSGERDCGSLWRKEFRK